MWKLLVNLCDTFHPATNNYIYKYSSFPLRNLKEGSVAFPAIQAGLCFILLLPQRLRPFAINYLLFVLSTSSSTLVLSLQPILVLYTPVQRKQINEKKQAHLSLYRGSPLPPVSSSHSNTL